ncbi:hypothetical protein EfmE1162_0018 [Enterococcus faecium E1162]|nr:hypothetical protein EfmE1162_0018 [Enterococcus faecium E1162]
MTIHHPAAPQLLETDSKKEPRLQAWFLFCVYVKNSYK